MKQLGPICIIVCKVNFCNGSIRKLWTLIESTPFCAYRDFQLQLAADPCSRHVPWSDNTKNRPNRWGRIFTTPSSPLSLVKGYNVSALWCTQVGACCTHFYFSTYQEIDILYFPVFKIIVRSFSTLIALFESLQSRRTMMKSLWRNFEIVDRWCSVWSMQPNAILWSYIGFAISQCWSLILTFWHFPLWLQTK